MELVVKAAVSLEDGMSEAAVRERLERDIQKLKSLPQNSSPNTKEHKFDAQQVPGVGLYALLEQRGEMLSAEEIAARDAAKRRRQEMRDAHHANIRRLAAMSPEERYTSSLILDTSELLRKAGKLDEAKQLSTDALEARRRLLGVDDPRTLTAMNNHALILREQRRFFEAQELLEEAVSVRRRCQGDAHPETLTAINNLAALLKDQGDLLEAEALYKEALASRRATLGDRHPDTLTSINNLAALKQHVGTLDALQEAEPLLMEASRAAVHSKQLGPSHPHSQIFVKNFKALSSALVQATQRGGRSEAEPAAAPASSGGGGGGGGVAVAPQEERVVPAAAVPAATPTQKAARPASTSPVTKVYNAVRHTRERKSSTDTLSPEARLLFDKGQAERKAEKERQAAKGKKALAEKMRKKGPSPAPGSTELFAFNRYAPRPSPPLNFAPVEPLSTSMLTSTTSSSSMTSARRSALSIKSQVPAFSGTLREPDEPRERGLGGPTFAYDESPKRSARRFGAPRSPPHSHRSQRSGSALPARPARPNSNLR